MARVVCQVVHRADRVTFIWSEGNAFFEPYSLEGAEHQGLVSVAAQARAALARGAGSAELAALGHQLYRRLFRLDADGGKEAQPIGRWLLELHAKGEVESLEFLSDAPTQVPWNLLCDATPADAPWDAFWGGKFNVASGKRTNPLRFSAPLVKPTALVAVDTNLANSRLDKWTGERLSLHSREELASRLRSSTPDVLVLLVPIVDGALRISGQAVTAAELREWIGEAREGNPNPVIFVGAVGSASDHEVLERWLAEAVDGLDGLIANPVPLAADPVAAAAMAFVDRFVEGHRPLAAALTDARRSLGGAGLAFTAFCPAGLAVTAEDADESAPPLPTQPLPEYPYSPLAAFSSDDRPLFFGREEETLRLAGLLDRAGTSAVILHGMAGVGKTSLVQAGLWPYLELECVGFRVLCDRSPEEEAAGESDYPPLMLRAGADLIGQLADGVFALCAQPLTYATPTGTVVTVDLPGILATHLGAVPKPPSTAIQEAAAPTDIAEPGVTPPTGGDADDEPALAPRDLWLAVREEPARMARLLAELTARLPFELVITIDQAEELLTLARTPSERERRQQAIELLAALQNAPARCKLVLILRTEYLGQLTALLPAGHGWKDFHLDDLDAAAMSDAVLGPTSHDDVLYSDEAPFARYGFSFEDGLAQQIVDDVTAEATRQQVSKLGLLQVVCAMLYDHAVLQRRQPVIRAADLRDIGGARQALARYVTQQISRLALPNPARDGLRQLISRLYTKHPDGRITRDLVADRELKHLWTAATPFQEAVNAAADQAGLFAIDELLVAGQHGLYVSLAHDTVAQAGKQMEAGVAVVGGGRKAVVDTLWIMIPLALLGAAATFFFTRNHYSGLAETEFKGYMKEIQPEIKKLVDYQEASRWPLYRGLLAQAQDALASGNVLAARQALLSEPATSATRDMRGFEWLYLWNKINGERKQFEGHKSTVTAVAVNADAKLAASASADGSIWLWNLTKNVPAARIPGVKGLSAVALSPDGKTVAAAGEDKTIGIWDISQLKEEFTTIDAEPRSLGGKEGHDGAVLALAFDKDGQTLVSGGADKAVIVWDAKTGKQRAKLTDHTARVQAVAFAPDGKTFATGAAESNLIVWSADGKKLHTVNSGLDSVSAIAFAPAGMVIDKAGQGLAAGGMVRAGGVETGTIRFWTIKTPLAAPEPTDVRAEHGREVLALAYLPGGGQIAQIASAGKDTNIRLWDPATGKQVGQWVGHLGWVDALAVSGTTLVSGSHDGTVKVWDTDRTKAEQVLRGHTGWVQAVAFGGGVKEANILVSGGKDGVVKIWDPTNGAPQGEIALKGAAITALAFAPTKPRILAVGTAAEKGDSDVKLFELVPADKGYTAKELHTLKGHKGPVTCLAFDPKGERLVSGSADKTAIIWNLEGKKLHTLTSEGEIRGLSFPNDQLIYGVGTDKVVRRWAADKGTPLRPSPPVHTDTIEAIDVQEGIAIATAGLDQTIRVLVSDEEGISVFAATRVERHPMTCMVRRRASPKHTVSFTGGWDGTIRITVSELDEDDEKKLRLDFHDRFTFTGHVGPVRALAMSADGTTLASASHDGTVRLWRAAPLRPIETGKDKKAK